MFGIGTGEIIAILIITMLVVGPERMVELAGTLGRMIAKFRRETDSMTQEFREALSIEELQQALDDAKREANQIGGEIEGAASEIKGAADAISNGELAAPDATTPAALPARAIASTAAAPTPSALAHAPAEDPELESEELSAPLFLEGEFGLSVSEEPSLLEPTVELLEQASPVLIHTALLVPDDREPEDVEIEVIQPTTVGPVLMVDEEAQDDGTAAQVLEPEPALAQQDTEPQSTEAPKNE